MSAQIDLYIASQRVPLSEDLGLRLSKSLSDIREPEKRRGEWSRTIKIPGSKEANILFGHIFDIKHRILGDPTASENFDPDFNPNLKAEALLFVDGCEALRGFLRLLSISQQEDGIIYECQIAGSTKDLFSDLEGKLLRDLDFSDLYHELNRTNISNSWATNYQRGGAPQAFAYGEGYVYPLIDQGDAALMRKFRTEDMYPALALREIFLNMFESAGYSWTSDSFFDSDFFKRLYYFHSGGSDGLTEAELLAKEWKAGRITTNQTIVPNGALVFNDDSGAIYYDPAGAYNTTSGIWTVPYNGKWSVSINLGTLIQFTPGSFGEAVPFFGVYRNGKLEADIICRGFNRNNTIQDIDMVGSTQPIFLNDGDEIEIRFLSFLDKNLYPYSNSEIQSFQMKKDESFGLVELESDSHGLGAVYNFAGFFSQDKTQRDLLLDIIRWFNLMVRPSGAKPRELIIKTESDFYSTDILDWSQKIDKSQPIELIPLGDLQDKKYRFRFKEAGDISNLNYLNKYGEPYGSYSYTINNDFLKSVRDIQLGLSITPLINYGSAWNAVLPHIEYPEGKISGGDRVLYYGGSKNCGTWSLSDASGSSAYTSYPFFGHIDDPISPTLDICYGMPREVALALNPGSTYTNNNSFNRFWRGKIEQIADPDSKILRAYFRLTAQDWEGCDLTELVYCEGEYFRINDIKDWDPVNDGLCLVELIRSRTPATFTPQQKRGGRGVDTSDGYGDRFPDPTKGYVSATGTNRPKVKLSGGGSDTIGGTDIGIYRSEVFNIAGQGNRVFSPAVQLFGCTNCIVHPDAAGSILIRCTDLEITIPGIYVENYLLSSYPVAPPSGSFPVSILGGDFEGTDAVIVF